MQAKISRVHWYAEFYAKIVLILDTSAKNFITQQTLVIVPEAKPALISYWLTWGGTCGPNGQKHWLKFLGLKCNPSNLQKAHFFCNLLQIIYLFQ